MAKHTLEELYQYQSLPLSVKISLTRERVKGWIREYGEDGVYISFSGGKDSTVLLDLIRNIHGRNRANMKRKNDALRRKLHLDELEEKDNAER